MSKKKKKRGTDTFARPEYGFCRAINHTWNRTPGLVVEKQQVVLELRCPCGCRRIDRIHATTGEVQRHYVYPDDYRFPGGAPKKPALRVAFLKALREAS